jgi:hypothetical protein
MLSTWHCLLQAPSPVPTAQTNTTTSPASTLAVASSPARTQGPSPTVLAAGATVAVVLVGLAICWSCRARVCKRKGPVLPAPPTGE